MIVNLTQKFIDSGLLVPAHLSKIEYVDDNRTGLYVLVSSKSQGQGSYFLRWKAANGKSTHLKLGRTTEISLSEVRRLAIKHRADISSLGRNPRAEEIARKAVLTYREFFLEHYWKHVELRKRSAHSDMSLFRVRLDAAFGDVRINQITKSKIQSFHNDIKAEGLAAATCNHYVKLLKHSLNLAIDWNLLEGPNPAARVPLFFEDNKKEDYLSDDQLEYFMQVLRTHPNRGICQLALALISTGCRLNELLSAKWTDVQMEKGIILIRATNSKNKKARVVPINSTMLQVLTELDTQGKYEYLFINKKTGKQFVNVAKSWQTLRKAAGLDHLTLHQLRHNFASFLVNSGRPIYEVKQLLGHADIKTTERYAHLSTKTLQEASNSASAVIRGAMLASVTAMPQLPSGDLQGDVLDVVPVALPEMLQAA